MSKQDNMLGQAGPVKGHIDFIEFFTYLLNTLYKNALNSLIMHVNAHQKLCMLMCENVHGLLWE